MKVLLFTYLNLILFFATAALPAIAANEKLIFHATAEEFDLIWPHLNAPMLKADLPDQAPGVIFAIKRIRAGGLNIICLVDTNNQARRQCDFYAENHPFAHTDAAIGGILEYRGAAAKEIVSKFLLKDLWFLTDHPLTEGKKIWRAGYAITRPEELFLWEFYFDGVEYFAHFSRIWNSDYYVFDMFERKSNALFDPQRDTFPKKEVVITPSFPSSSSVDDLFLEGMRGSIFGDRKREAMAE